MAEIAAIGIHNDLPAGEAGVPGRTAHNKFAGGVDIDMIHVPDVKAIPGQHRRNDHFLHILPQILNGKVRAVHDGHHHGLHPHRPARLVKFHSHLGLSIGAQVGVFRHHLGQPVGEGSGNRTGKRHQLRGLVAGAAEHHALVSRAAHLVIGSQSNVRGLV